MYSDRILLTNLQTFTHIITNQTWIVAHMRTYRGRSQVFMLHSSVLAGICLINHLSSLLEDASYFCRVISRLLIN